MTLMFFFPHVFWIRSGITSSTGIPSSMSRRRIAKFPGKEARLIFCDCGVAPVDMLITVDSLSHMVLSKKISTDPWNIPQVLKQLPVYRGNSFMFVFWGTWGMFHGFVEGNHWITCNFFDGCSSHLESLPKCHVQC